MNKVAEFITDKDLDITCFKKACDKLSELREQMLAHNIDAWIIPTADPHNCEYPPERWHGRSWISEFTGSAGTFVVMKDKALLWTDGRYHIQAEEQFKDTNISVMITSLPDTPTIAEWLSENLSTGSTVGFDGKSMPYSEYSSMEDEFQNSEINFQIDIDLLDLIWENRPQIPTSAVFEHELSFAGKSRSEKLIEVRQLMSQKKTDCFIISSLDDIAWLFNIRGSDVKNCSTTLCYAIISESKAWLCINQSKISPRLNTVLTEDKISIVDYSEVFSLSASIAEGSTIYLDSSTTSTYLYNCIKPTCRIISGINFTTDLKAIKNDTEVKNFRKCLIRDGAHVLTFMKWLEESAGTEKITELSAAKKLDSIRAKDSLFHGQSFTTIAGFGANGAQMHYLPSKESDTEITTDNFLLVDSGGLYKDGTTDITRTFSFGNLSKEQIHDYSLVVKAHINMARTAFLRGCRGTQIDYAARADMWREGINYNCATGHGVGFFLNVHEGPINVGQRFIDAELKPGMIITNEPGIYRSGKHGVRIENIMLCYEKETTEFGTFYAFETISPCPIETNTLDTSLLNDEEINWLNDYHKTVYEQLSPLLDEEHKTYLKSKTSPIQR